MWQQSFVDFEDQCYPWEAKVYDRPSVWGLDSGRVSKLYIYDPFTHKLIFCFDRGHWGGDPEVRPPNELLEVIMARIH